MNKNLKNITNFLAALKPEDFPLSASELDCIVEAGLKRDARWLIQQHKHFTASLEKHSKHNQLAKKWQQRAQASLTTASLREQEFDEIIYPKDLPITASIADIKSAISAHQVVIVAGETGSGKTTQIPKVCADLGFGVRGRIGHTQPRRLAARTVAARIANELSVNLGKGVGYQFRFNAQCDESTRIKLMTDGILLAEISRDRLLNDYDVIIIDEAHERSLNIDFLLGYLKLLLPKRPDLKLIVTSATIDVARFSDYFNAAPVLTISGRSYPVSIKYIDTDNIAGQPQEIALNPSKNIKRNDEAQIDDLPSKIAYALDLIQTEKQTSVNAKDVLVFLPGEREIRELSKVLRKDNLSFEVLPLYSRLSQAEQQKIFSTSNRTHKRRVVLATNVAETSITVPGIGYVIDAGLARVSRYSARSKLQRLPIEAISQASAKQRAGRCGRLAAGVCYRLYSEDDFLQRAEFTEPEIHRTNLASVILQMKTMGLVEIGQFPFIEPPDPRQIRAGIKVLQELNALTPKGKLSSLGKKLARLPIDPKLGRMLLAGQEKNCLSEMLIIVSALAVQDPRETPADKRQAADMQHRRFWHEKSDFIIWLNLWSYVERLREDLSQRQFRNRCKREFLSYTRLREWRDVHWQLRLALKTVAVKQQPTSNSLRQAATPGLQQGLKSNTTNTNSLDTDDPNPINIGTVDYENIHRAILTGIPLNIGKKEDKGQYRGARELQFFLFPASSQFKAAPQWVLSGDIVETKKVYARSVAAIESDWIAKELTHLTKLQYGEPFWHKNRGQVIAKQATIFYGLTVAANKQVSYETIDADKSRQVFIRQALVQQALLPDKRLEKLAQFWGKNGALIKKIQRVEEKLRRRDLLIDDESIVQFYDKHLPESINSRASLTQWLQTHATEQARLIFDENDILSSSDFSERIEQFPDQLTINKQPFKLRYCFEPGSEHDGVTASISLGALNTLAINAFDWLVPGMLLDKCIDMLKALPKSQRKHLLPIPTTAKQLLAKINVVEAISNNQPLAQALAKQAHIYHNVDIDYLAWQQLCNKSLDIYYCMRFEIIDLNGRVIEQGRNLLQLQQASMQQLDKNISEYGEKSFQREKITHWDFGELAEEVASKSDQTHLSGYPALLDKGESVTLTLLSSADEASELTQKGLLRLAMLAMKDKVRYLKKQLCKDALIILPFVHIGRRNDLVNDLISAAIASSCFDDFCESLPRNQQAFIQHIDSGKSELLVRANAIELILFEVLAAYKEINALLELKRKHFSNLCEDIDYQLSHLIYLGFLQATGYRQLQHLPRYMKALVIRLERMGVQLKKEQEMCEKLSSLERPLQNLLYKYPHALFFDQRVNDFRWLVEELRVSVFAQQLKTAVPVSFQRVSKSWDAINLNSYPLSR